MLTHLFKLIWNKKKQNFLLMIEVLVSFMILFAVLTAIVYYYQNYRRPMGLDYENVWMMDYESPHGMKDGDSVAAFRASVRQLIGSMPQVAEVSFASRNVPFSFNTNGGGVNYGKKNEGTNKYTVDDNYGSLLHVGLKEGRWFSKEDDGAKEEHIVINATLKKNLFGDESAIGKMVGEGGDGPKSMKIIGVIGDLKDEGDFAGPSSGVYRRVDTSNLNWGGSILIRVRPSAD